MTTAFRVGITRDFLKRDGSLAFGDIGISLLEGKPSVKWEFLDMDEAELSSDHAGRYDALVVLAPRVTAHTLRARERLALVARFGVGYDTVDVDACTRAGVALTITPDGVRRPVAMSAILFLLALSHRLFAKDRITRSGRWAEKLDYTGTGLTGRTLGLIGLGNIGKEVFRLARPFDMKHVAYDPYVRPDAAAGVGAQLVDLPALMRSADFICICCALTPETHHLIDAERISLMKPTAYLINVARGPIVDQAALTWALVEHRIEGAALDVFEKEPPDAGEKLLTLENVILSPHAICWTDECFKGIGRDAFGSVLDVAQGRAPRNVVNRQVLESPLFQAKLARFASR